jgi:hypothetical protein
VANISVEPISLMRLPSVNEVDGKEEVSEIVWRFTSWLRYGSLSTK